MPYSRLNDRYYVTMKGQIDGTPSRGKEDSVNLSKVLVTHSQK